MSEKKYTIKPLEWEINAQGEAVADVPGLWRYVVARMPHRSGKWESMAWTDHTGRWVGRSDTRNAGQEACQTHLNALVAGFMAEVEEQ